MSYIINIGTAVPEHSISQTEFAKTYASLSENADIQRKIKFLNARSAIEKRHTVQPDITQLLNLSLEQKLALYHTEATKLATQAVLANPAFEDRRAQITDLIVVSCTGMQAPGVEFELIENLSLSKKIRRYNVNFMGCYAALTALRMAKDICTTPNRTVLVVSIELCTHHFQHNFTDDYLLSNSLFADGSASAIVSSDKVGAKLKLNDFGSRLLPNSKEEMSWKISNSGFLMTLSSEVPSSISASLQNEPLFGKLPQNVSWAIHPGGKQILDGIKNTLQLDETELTISRQILATYGNMSSATIFFVLQKMLEHRSTQKEQFIACAFGPGLTLESALLSYV